MAFGENSTIGELMKNEAAKTVMEKHIPGFSKHPQLSMAMGMNLKTVATFPQSNISKELLAAICDDLAKL